MKITEIIKRFTATTLGATFLLSFAACSTPENTPTSVTVWAATGMEKILRDEDYSSRYAQTTLSIAAFRNEYESGQIIISADGKVDSYELTTSDLTLAGNPEVKLAKENFEIYNQKYIYLDRITESNMKNVPGGYYPDALLPWETAVEYGENKMDGGKNQGIWVTLKTDETQQAGTYTGEFSLKIEEETVKVPVEVTLYNHALSDETHVQSWYGLNWNWVAMGELDVTMEMQEKYYDYLLDYRINPSNVPGNFYAQTYPDNFMETLLEQYAEAANDPRCSFYSLPYSTKTTVDLGKTLTVMDLDYHLNLIQQMAKYSVEHEVDLFKKAGIYLVYLDEFDAQGSDNSKNDNASYTLHHFWNFRQELDEADVFALVEGEVDEDFKTQLMESVMTIAPFVPGDAFRLNFEDYPNAKLISMDRIRMYASEERREAYQDYMKEAYNEQWWYQANPQYPSVSYTTEAPAVNVRFNGWMMYDYGITGDLYWEIAMNHQFTRSYSYEYIQDQFDTAMRYPSSNGEGKLIYAGREYGIYGPVGTVRLHAVRDSHEDYDLLYELEELYATRGVTSEQFNSILQFLVEDLYEGTSLIDANNAIDVILNSREVLNTLFELYYENGVVLESYEKIKGVGTMKLSAANDTELKVNGTLLSGEDKGSYTAYSHQIALNQDKNEIKIEAKTGDKTHAITFDLGAKNVVTDASHLTEKLSVTGGEAAVAYDEATLATKITPANESTLSVTLDASSLEINNSYTSMSLRIYVYGDEDVSVTLLRSRSGDPVLETVRAYTLSAGWNEITLDVANDLKCTKTKKLASLVFRTQDTTVSYGIGDLILVG